MLVPERAQVCRERRVLVLEAVRLVDDHVAPRHLVRVSGQWSVVSGLVRVRVGR